MKKNSPIIVMRKLLNKTEKKKIGEIKIRIVYLQAILDDILTLDSSSRDESELPTSIEVEKIMQEVGDEEGEITTALDKLHMSLCRKVANAEASYYFKKGVDMGKKVKL